MRSLGVDLDPLLVQRAVEGNSCRQGEVAFLTLDLLGPRDQVLQPPASILQSPVSSLHSLAINLQPPVSSL